MSNPNPPVPVARIPRWLVWGAVFAVLAAYAGFLIAHSTVVAGGSDSSGYLNSARLLAAGRWQTHLRVPAEFGPPAALTRLHFSPQGFYTYENNPQLTPTYPSGLPLHFALAGKIFGWQVGPLLVALGAALGAIGLCYAVARQLGLSCSFAAAGATALGTCPVFLFSSIQPLSDTLATLWCLAAVLSALYARRSIGWAAACGAALGVAVLVRPTNVALLPALVVLLGLDWRRLALATLGGLSAIVWLAVYNRALYGGALESGYGDWKSAFALRYVAPTSLHFAHWLALLLPAVFIVSPLFVLARRTTRAREVLALALWFGAIFGVYACYEVSHEVWWCLRFILPAIPALILAALLGLESAAQLLTARSSDRFRMGAALLLIGWAVGGSWYWTRKLGVLYIKGYEQVYADATQAAKTQLPPDALVVASVLSGALYYYTDFPVLRWDLLNAPEFVRYAALAQKAGRPIVAALYETEEDGALHEHCPGAWTRIGGVKSVGFWRFTPSPAFGINPK